MIISLGSGWKYDGSTYRYPDWDDEKAMNEQKKIDEFKGVIGIDKGDYGQHYKRDIRRGLPFSDNTVEEIIADNSLEHIPYGEHFGEDDFVFIMNECLRVLKPNGIMKILAPNAGKSMSFKDPTHARFITPVTFSYLDKKNPWEYGFDKRWKVIKVKLLQDDNLIFFKLRAVK